MRDIVETIFPLKIWWKIFSCKCKCRCFHKPTKEEWETFTKEFQEKDIYICNACGQAFEWE